MNDRTPKLYLTRRNLLTLIAKLDRDQAGERTACTIVKYKNPNVPAYQQTMGEILVIAVQDEDFYSAQERPAGEMHPAEEANLQAPSTGVRLHSDF